MKRDVNFTLIALIISTVIILIGFTVYYQKLFTDLYTDYNEKVSRLERVTEELGIHKSELNKTSIQFEEEKESLNDLSNRYSELRGEKETLLSEKDTLTKSLTEKSAQLLEKQAELTKKTSQLSNCQDDLRDVREKNAILDADLDDCEDDYDECSAQLSICQG